MFKFLQVSALALVVMLSSSCFDVVEEYFFNKDGSGTASFQVDMSQMMSMMEMFGAMADSSGDGEDPMGELNEIFEENEAIAMLQGIAGISNVRNLNDKENSIFGYAYDFENIDALNNAISANQSSDILMSAALGMEEGGDESEPAGQFKRKGKKFERTHAVDASVEARMKEKEESGEEEGEEEGMMAMLFADASYKIIYNFEQGVKKCKHDDAKISSDGKSVVLEVPMDQLMKGGATLSTKIKTR